MYWMIDYEFGWFPTTSGKSLLQNMSFLSKIMNTYTENRLFLFISVAPFLEIKAIWLAFDSLFYFTTKHLILREKGKKSSKHPFEKI